jgi:hypothetical protein
VTPEERERFESIERDLAITAEIQKKVATNLLRLVTSLEVTEANLNAFITESREGRKNLQAELEAFLRAGRKDDKT